MVNRYAASSTQPSIQFQKTRTAEPECSRHSSGSPSFQRKIDLFSSSCGFGFPVEGGVDYIAHFPKPPLGALPALLAAKRSRTGLVCVEGDLKLIYHAITLNGTVRHRMSDRKRYFLHNSLSRRGCWQLVVSFSVSYFGRGEAPSNGANLSAVLVPFYWIDRRPGTIHPPSK